jgi:hypothetical protein
VTGVQQLNATDMAIDVRAEFLSDIGYNLTQYGVALDAVGYDRPISTFWTQQGNRILDLIGPSGTSTAFTIIDQNTASTSWTVSDVSPLLHTYGMLALKDTDYVIGSKTIIDNTTGVDYKSTWKS